MMTRSRLKKESLSLEVLMDEDKTAFEYDGARERVIVRMRSSNKTKPPVAEYDMAAMEGGANGHVFLLRLLPEHTNRVTEDARELVLKLEIYNDEYAIARAMKSQGIKCDIVPMRKLDKHAFYQRMDDKDVKMFAVIMKKMDSTLHEWLGSKQYRRTSDPMHLKCVDFIMGSIEDQMNCILKVNPKLVYADLKPNNVGIMLDKTSNSIERVHLIDLGSAMPNAKRQYTATFTCVPHKKGVGLVPLENEDIRLRCVYFQLYIMILFLTAENQEQREALYRYRFDQAKKTKRYFTTLLPIHVRALKSKLAYPRLQYILGELLRLLETKSM